ncbi:MAG TPA: carboxylesterase family protein, partial [Thauera aminoaromatica]|nr:carboxylesterase family protein [Thauera aminoaromatica]
MRDATAPGTRCVQDTVRDPDYGRPVGEDCLSLNVFSPAGAAARPVMVWIHGGAFANGSADIYDARRLVTRGDAVTGVEVAIVDGDDPQAVGSLTVVAPRVCVSASATGTPA